MVKIWRIGIIQPHIFFRESKTDIENETINYNHALGLLNHFKRGQTDLIVLPETYPCCNFDWVTSKDDFSNMAKHLWSGTSPKVFKLEGLTTGILICSDFFDYELPEKLAKQGCELIIIPSNAVPALINLWKVELSYIVDIFNIPIVWVNNALHKKGDHYSGGGRSKLMASINFFGEIDYKHSKNPQVFIDDFILEELGEREEVKILTLDKFKKYEEIRKGKPPVTIRR